MALMVAPVGGFPPIIMGHEASGIVAEVGSVVQGFTFGDRITFDSTIYCGKCYRPYLSEQRPTNGLVMKMTEAKTVKKGPILVILSSKHTL